MDVPQQTLLPISDGYWEQIKDGDPHGRVMLDRHYSGRKRKSDTNLFVGPGEKLVLSTADRRALFVWRKFVSMDKQDGVNCAVFRNEGDLRSSDLIREAMDIAWQRWPGQRLYTYVNPKRIKSSNPGYCFKQAGWRFWGYTKGGLHVLEAYAAKHDAKVIEVRI